MSQPNLSIQKNVPEYEKYFRECVLTFNDKKNELVKLKSEVDCLSNENYELSKTVENLKKTIEENQITTNIFMQKAQDYEHKHQEKRDMFTKLQVQHKMTAVKIDGLREELQSALVEKAQCLKKLASIEEKSKLDSVFKNEFTTKLTHLKDVVNNINRDMGMIKHDQVEVVKKIDNMNLSTDFLEKHKQLTDINKVLKERNFELEEESIKSQAKINKLEELISTHQIKKEDKGLETKVLLHKLTIMTEHFKQKIQNKNEIISALGENIQQEKNNNAKLIKENKELQFKNQDLTEANETFKEKLDVHGVQTNSCKEGEVEKILSLSQIEITDDTECPKVKQETVEIIQIDDD